MTCYKCGKEYLMQGYYKPITKYIWSELSTNPIKQIGPEYAVYCSECIDIEEWYHDSCNSEES